MGWISRTVLSEESTTMWFRFFKILDKIIEMEGKWKVLVGDGGVYESDRKKV